MAGPVGSSLALPSGIHPIWLEGAVTQEYERDTLPLLFAPEEQFKEYYEALTRQYPAHTAKLEQIRQRNRQARSQRAEGFWQECLHSLMHCVQQRRIIFDDNEFQYTAAQIHFVLSIYSFASFYLTESRNADPELRAGLQARAFDLFKRADLAARDVEQPQHRRYLLAVVSNNLANYFYRRRKMKAAAQQVQLSVKHWRLARVPRNTSYFRAREASALCFAERWADAARELNSWAASVQFPSADEGEEPAPAEKEAPPEEDYGAAPVRFQVQLVGNPMPIADACQIVVSHNLAVAYIGLRRYKEAAEWCQKAMDACSAAAAHLSAGHLWVRAVKSCQTLCQKTSFSQHYTRFKMKPQDTHVPEFQKMQRIINETRTMPIFNSLVEIYRKQRLEEYEARKQQEESRKRYADELRRKAEVNLASRGAGVVFNGKPQQWSPPRSVRSSPPPSARHKPLSALRMYLQQTSYKQFVDDYTRHGGWAAEQGQPAEGGGAQGPLAPRPPGGAAPQRVVRSAGPAGGPRTARQPAPPKGSGTAPRAQSAGYSPAEQPRVDAVTVAAGDRTDADAGDAEDSS
eukprot:TRINITY_DN65021_c0_g1_i1.p1 TRINITY_DN65021_c0_g1~~TRINITY_DN65021_c0_g1_i1.p1  ORF type:complete len:573 (+),score=148.62 TRINITY_DN65021_c0_g1_i1:90-1808(+)